MTGELLPGAVLARYGPPVEDVPSLLTARVERCPAAPALEFGARRLTYADLERATLACAGFLLQRGVVAGDTLAFCGPNSDLEVCLFLACARLGVLFAPLNPGLTDSELSWLVGHTRPRLLVCTEALHARATGWAEWLSPPVCLRELGETAPDGPALLSALEAWSVPAPVAAQADTPLVVVHTSGTTGFPKGVVHTHRNYVWAAEAFVERMHLQPAERLLTVLPFFHINALFYSLGGALAAGACLIIGGTFSASRFWDLAVATRATQFNTLAAVGSILCRRPRSEFNPRHSLRKVYGGPISPEVERTFREEFGVPLLVEGYGMSEIPGACNNPCRGQHKSGSMGLPARHPRHGEFVEMRIVDEAGQALPAGQPGELEVRTPIIFREYLRDPVQTAAAFHDGWFRTGDLVWRDAEGYHFFVARLKDIIRVRGENIAGAELDRVLGEHPAVAEAATLGVASELGEEEIFAVLVSRGDRPSFASLAQWCATRLAAIKIPRYWAWVEELPHTPSHRVAKHQLKAHLAEIPRHDLRQG